MCRNASKGAVGKLYMMVFRRLCSLIRTHVMFCMLLVLGALVRFWHLSYGLSDIYLEDEEFFIEPALRVAEHLDHFSGWDPHWYGAPAAPLISVLAILFRVTSAIVNLVNHSAFSVAHNFLSHIVLFVTFGRMLSVAAAIATMVLLYRIGALWSRAVGLWTMFFYAISFYCIQYAHIIRPDVAQTFFLLLSIYALLMIERAREHTQLRWHVILGSAFALACTLKYPSFFLAPVFALYAGVALYRDRNTWKQWVACVFAALLTAMCSAPFIFLNFSAALQDIQFEGTTLHAEHMSVSLSANIVYYFFDVMSWQVGTALLVIACVGLCVGLANPHYRRALFLFIGCIACYTIGISSLQLHWERWCIPLTTCVYFLSAIGIEAALRVCARRSAQIAFIVIIVAAPSMRCLRTLIAYTQPHTEQVAERWVSTHMSASNRVVREPYTPQDIVNVVATLPNATQHSLRWYRDHQIDTLFLGAVYERITRLALHEHSREEFVRADRAYRRMMNASVVVFSLEPYPIDCLYASDWSVLFSAGCGHPFFGEGQYVLELREIMDGF